MFELFVYALCAHVFVVLPVWGIVVANRPERAR